MLQGVCTGHGGVQVGHGFVPQVHRVEGVWVSQQGCECRAWDARGFVNGVCKLGVLGAVPCKALVQEASNGQEHVLAHAHGAPWDVVVACGWGGRFGQGRPVPGINPRPGPFLAAAIPHHAGQSGIPPRGRVRVLQGRLQPQKVVGVHTKVHISEHEPLGGAPQRPHIHEQALVDEVGVFRQHQGRHQDSEPFACVIHFTGHGLCQLGHGKGLLAAAAAALALLLHHNVHQNLRRHRGLGCLEVHVRLPQGF